LIADLLLSCFIPAYPHGLPHQTSSDALSCPAPPSTDRPLFLIFPLLRSRPFRSSFACQAFLLLILLFLRTQLLFFPRSRSFDLFETVVLERASSAGGLSQLFEPLGNWERIDAES
jgi:hypothetical protein